MALGRSVATAALIVAVAVTGILLFGASGGYTVTARFANAGQLVRGAPVQAGGAPVGSVRSIRLSADGRADVKLAIHGDQAPLPAGTRAVVKEHSLAGVADRYVELEFPDYATSRGRTIPDGGLIDSDRTSTQVELDQVFQTLDAPTRRAIRRTIAYSAGALKGRGARLAAGIEYLDPGLAGASRLLDELTRERPLLESTLADSSRVVSALARRRDAIVTLVSELGRTSRAVAGEKGALAESLERLPPFMRRANSTFVDLRSALDDLDPLVRAAHPLARNLRELLPAARALAARSRPALRDLRLALRRPGAANDLVELLRALPPLEQIAVERRRRSTAPGGHSVDVGLTRGAFPEAVDALGGATPVIGLARPYTSDFLGWLDDFSTTGAFFDALGGGSRTLVNFAENMHGGPPKQRQFHRCPGGADIVAPDRSNLLSREEQRRLHCSESERAVR